MAGSFHALELRLLPELRRERVVVAVQDEPVQRPGGPPAPLLVERLGAIALGIHRRGGRLHRGGDRVLPEAFLLELRPRLALDVLGVHVDADVDVDGGGADGDV